MKTTFLDTPILHNNLASHGKVQVADLFNIFFSYYEFIQ